MAALLYKTAASLPECLPAHDAMLHPSEAFSLLLQSHSVLFFCTSVCTRRCYHHSIGGESHGREDRKLRIQRESNPPRREIPSAIGHLDRHPPARPCPLSAALHSIEMPIRYNAASLLRRLCYLHVHVVAVAIAIAFAFAFAVCCLTHPQGPFAAA